MSRPAASATRVVTANWDDPNVFGIDGYTAAGGYEGLRTALGMTPADVIDVVKTSGQSSISIVLGTASTLQRSDTSCV